MLAAACTSILLCTLAACTSAEDERIVSGQTMGTTYSVHITGCAELDCNSLEPRLSRQLDEINQRFSHYDEGSELSRFNAHESTDWFEASPELASIVDYALTVSRESDGAFDITLAAAVNHWGFGPKKFDSLAPNSRELATALRHSGYEKLDVNEHTPALRKSDPLLQLDLSAIAKGYAVDQLAYLLESQGVRSYLVEIGGEIRTAGTRTDGKPWHIGIQPPAGGLNIEFVVAPGDSAIATSGDYQNFYMIDERRVSHTIDPANGTPVDNRLASVSIIAPNAMQADAWATALMVMGSDAGAQFAAENDIAALFLVRNDGGIDHVTTPEFDQYLLTGP